MSSMDNSPFISREESLLVIIDMQERLVPAVSQHEKVVGNTKRLLALADTLHLPVVVTEQEKLGQTIAEIRERMTDLAPVAKVTFNCFSCEPFAQKIRELQRNTLIITGIEAHICVAQTALWAHPQFRVHVVSDAISSRSPDNVCVAVERMRATGVTITSTEMVIYELLQKAGTEEFRTMLPHVK
jgi:nicotinamidase-related amidase